jgi:hypothetical protein
MGDVSRIIYAHFGRRRKTSREASMPSCSRLHGNFVPSYPPSVLSQLPLTHRAPGPKTRPSPSLLPSFHVTSLLWKHRPRSPKPRSPKGPSTEIHLRPRPRLPADIARRRIAPAAAVRNGDESRAASGRARVWLENHSSVRKGERTRDGIE